MEPLSVLLTSAVGYILKGAASSKAAGAAKEELLSGFWEMVRPYFLEDIPEIEDKADEEETEKKVSDRLLKLIEEDKDFLPMLAEKVAALKAAGIKEKNVFRGDIKNMKKIRIGDKEMSTDEIYDKKNIVEGNVEGGDEFILGDGH